MHGKKVFRRRHSCHGIISPTRPPSATSSRHDYAADKGPACPSAAPRAARARAPRAFRVPPRQAALAAAASHPRETPGLGPGCAPAVVVLVLARPPALVGGRG